MLPGWKRRRQETQNLMPRVESEALEAKRLAILAATEWIGTGKGRDKGLKMKELCQIYSVQHCHWQNVY